MNWYSFPITGRGTDSDAHWAKLEKRRMFWYIISMGHFWESFKKRDAKQNFNLGLNVIDIIVNFLSLYLRTPRCVYLFTV
jgi:hypothetical protein